MDFGTFNLFNFFQQPVNTGSLPDLWNPDNLNTILTDNGHTGTVGDFNWFYPYAGTNISLNLIKASIEYHPINLYQETNSFLGGYGLWDPTIITSFSGKLSSNKDSAGLVSKFSGKMAPKMTEICQLESSFSGRSLKAGPHTGQINTYLSGLVKRGPSGVFSALFTFSGKTQGRVDYGSINSEFSGNINGLEAEISSMETVMWGKMIPISQDFMTGITYTIADFSVGQDYTWNSYTGIDSSEIGYGIYSISVNSDGACN